MTLMNTLAFALLALGLVAAHTIPDIAPELEKKLAEVVAEAIKDEKPIENVASEQELIDQANTIKDVENKLRMKPTEIPVKVVQEDVKLKNSVSEEEISDAGVKHAEPDLEHPGAPQHQEHNAQNAVHYEDSQILLTNIKKAIADSQTAFNQGYAVVSEHVRNFFIKDEQIDPIQNSIRELQNSFTTQIEKLNEFVRNSFTAQNENNVAVPEKETKLRNGLETIESQLKQVESKFQKGLNTISNGVEVFAKVKAETSGEQAIPAAEAVPSAPEPAPAPAPAPAPPTNPLGDFISMWQTNVQNGLNNVQNSLSNLFSGQNQNQPTASQPAQSANQPTLSEGSSESTVAGQGNPFQGPLQLFQSIFNPGSNNAAPAGAQADETQRPNLLQQVQQGLQGGLQNLQNIFIPNQQQTPQQQAVQSDVQQPAANQPNRPFDLANIPVIGSVVQFLQPKPPATQPIKPADPVKKPAEPTNAEIPSKGTNMVPEKMDSDAAPAATSVQPAIPVEPPKGPIQQISQQIQKNPIVKGIQGAVQRFQHTISRSPDEPRDSVTEKGGKPEGALTTKSDMSAAKGHGGDGVNNGDSNNSDNSGIIEDKLQKKDANKSNAEEQKEPQKIEEPQKLEEPQKSDVVSSSLPAMPGSMDMKL